MGASIQNLVRAVAGALRDTLATIQLGVGPVMQLEKTFALVAGTNSFVVTVPATMAITYWEMRTDAAANFPTSVSIGALEYYTKLDNQLAPTFGAAAAYQEPSFFWGFLRRIQVIQGDTIVINVTAAAPGFVTWRHTGYRLGKADCV